jgi:hypothetical protein
MTTIHLKRNLVFSLYLALKNLPTGMLYNKIFLFYIESNIALLERMFDVIYALKESTDPKGEFLEFLNQKNTLITKYAFKDEKGNIIFQENGEIGFAENDVKSFEFEYSQLINTYSTVIKEHDSYCNEVGQLLTEEIPVQVELIPFKYIPEELPKEYCEYYKLLFKESDQWILEKYK